MPDDDKITIEKIVAEYTEPIYAFISRLVGGGEEEASDVTQEVFVKVWKNLDKYDETQSLKPWLFKIARNTAIDWLRRRRNIPFSRLDYQDDEGGEQYFSDTLVDDEMLPDEVFAQVEIREKFKKALESLSVAERAIVTLHLEEGFTFNEISEIVGRPLNTVKSAYRRSMLKLRGVLGGAGFEHQNDDY